MQLHFYTKCHVTIWCYSLCLLQPWFFQVCIHARLSILFNTLCLKKLYNMKPITMLIFGWGCRGWNICLPIVMFKHAMKFVDHPPSHLLWYFSNLHFVRLLGFSSIMLPCHSLATSCTSFFDLWVILFFFYGFDKFLWFPSTTSFSFDATRTFAMEVNLWCFASYLVGGCNPWNVLNEHICLMTMSSTIFLSYSSSILLGF